ncbi:MAG: metal-dependent transcriptional regulator, partial [Candidatus Micrarchaeota archaeon]
AQLGVSQPSVSEMFRKLAREKLITHTPYRGAVLTKKGEEIGKGITRKHRLIERFLALLGIGKKKLHKEACVLEHAVSDEVEAHIGEVVKSRTTPLTSLKEGEGGKVVWISAGRGASRRLADMGVTSETRISVVNSAPFRGPVEINVRGTRLAIGRGLASKIFVEVGK